MLLIILNDKTKHNNGKIETSEIFYLTLSKKIVCVLQEIIGSNIRRINEREQICSAYYKQHRMLALGVAELPRNVAEVKSEQ